MSQNDANSPMDLVDGVCVRASNDVDLKARLLADPRTTLLEETALTIPSDWELVASEAADGTVRVELANEDIPDAYLELVSGGLPESSTDSGNASC